LTTALLWRPAYVAIGSNLQSPKDRVLEAFDRLHGLPATKLLLRSRLYATEPMGPQQQPFYVNAAAGLLTQLTARELLDRLLQVERAMGRTRQERWGPRVIDLDLVWMVGSVLAEPGLTVPHPGVSMRNFVLYPLADIAPTMKIPGHGNVLDLKVAIGNHGIAELQQ
jgi:2-amino-4-hydroxy-6-hydroxymethyldihydropteridine diphosphokinase